jgi:hypothetical protein
MISEWRIGKDVEGRSRSLTSGTITAFTWREWNKNPLKTSVKTDGLWFAVWIREVPNTKQECQLLDDDFRSAMLEAVRTSETSVYFNQIARRYIPEGCNLYARRRDTPLCWYLLNTTHLCTRSRPPPTHGNRHLHGGTRRSNAVMKLMRRFHVITNKSTHAARTSHGILENSESSPTVWQLYKMRVTKQKFTLKHILGW